MNACGVTLCGDLNYVPAAWTHNHHRMVRMATCVLFALVYLICGLSLILTYSQLMGAVCIANGLAFVMVLALLRMRFTPAWLVEFALAAMYTVSSVSSLFLLLAWDCEICDHCVEVRGRGYGILVILMKSVLVINGIPLRASFVYLTVAFLSECIYLYTTNLMHGYPSTVGAYGLVFCLYVGYVATSASRHREMLMLYKAKIQLSIQMETVQTLANMNSDALVWVEADGNTLAKGDERLGRWLGFKTDSSLEKSSLADFMSSEAYAQFQDILTSPTCAPVVMVPTELRHASGKDVNAHLAVVDQRSVFVGDAERARGFLVAVTLMDYAAELYGHGEGPRDGFVQAPILQRGSMAMSEITNGRRSDSVLDAIDDFLPGEIPEAFSIVPVRTPVS